MALLLFRLGIYAPKGGRRALGLIQMLLAATKRDKPGREFLIPRLLRVDRFTFLLVVFVKLQNFFAYLLMILFLLSCDVLEGCIGEMFWPNKK